MLKLISILTNQRPERITRSWPSPSILTREAERPRPVYVSTLAARAINEQGGKTVNGVRKTVAAAAIAGSMLVGGVAGAVLYGVTTLTASAATPSPSPSSSSTGQFVPNEDPTHEAGESAAREAQENAGQVPTVP